MKHNHYFRTMMLALMVMAGTSMLCADVYEDDIYYNPKNAKTTKSDSKKSNYIKDFQDQDVDAYNMRGQYYATPVDTIGRSVSNGEDFVYTQEIQKYYNPTIVVDNADIVGDILENSYGNVEVVYNINGVPSFAPYYNPWAYRYPYGGWSWNYWGPTISIGWSDPFWGPSWSWGWGPAWGPSWSWGWGPSWGPAWGPSWGWGPSWRPGWGGGWHHADYRPQGHRPGGARPGWAHSTRPGGNYNGGHGVSGGRNPHYSPSTPGASGSPSYNGNSTGRQPGRGYIGTSSDRNNNRGNAGSSNQNRQPSYNSNGTSRPAGGYKVDSDGHRRSNSSTTTQTPSRYNSNKSTPRSNSNSSTQRSNSSTRRSDSYSSPSRSSGRSGGYSGGSRGGGGYRGGGGGGARGGHR